MESGKYVDYVTEIQASHKLGYPAEIIIWWYTGNRSVGGRVWKRI